MEITRNTVNPNSLILTQLTEGFSFHNNMEKDLQTSIMTVHLNFIPLKKISKGHANISGSKVKLEIQ